MYRDRGYIVQSGYGTIQMGEGIGESGVGKKFQNYSIKACFSSISQ